MDIGVYTTEDVLDHKKEDGRSSDGRYCYWTFPRRTKSQRHDKLFFATKGRWQGYFEITEVWEEGGEVDFSSESWHELKEKPERKPFQGFTYKVPEV